MQTGDPKHVPKLGALFCFIKKSLKLPVNVGKSTLMLFIFPWLSGGISSDLEDKRKQFQGKRKQHITDSSQLKNFPCKKFRKVCSV